MRYNRGHEGTGIREMKRWLFNISAAMSLLLCVLIFGLWLRSYTSRDEVLWMSWNSKIVRYSEKAVAWDQGQLDVVYHSVDYPPGWTWANDPRKAGWRFFSYPLGPGTLEWNWWRYESNGAGVGRGRLMGSFDRAYKIEVAMGPLIVLTAITPAWWIWTALRRRNKRMPGYCRVCGYDLRATPERCPECGTVPSGKGEEKGRGQKVG